MNQMNKGGCLNMVEKYKKKPIVVEAIQYTGGNKKEIIDFTEGKATTNTCYSHLTIPTLEGDHKADVGDWVIKGIRGEFYPCKPDIFDATYELVTDENGKMQKL